MSESANFEYKTSIATYLHVNASQVFLFWKGRVALYAILKALGVGKDDEVIIPAFTCVVVPNAIMYLGAKPIYVDIDPLTYNINIEKVANAINAKTKVIIAQNTFGLSADIDALTSIANKHHIALIEDCTHGMGGFYKNKANGTLCSASFFSTQWNKPFSTGIGGIAYIADPKLAQALHLAENELASPSAKESFMLQLQLWVRKHLINATTYWIAVNTYRWLSKNNIITGSSQGEELEMPIMPHGFNKGLSSIQAKEGAKQIKKLDTYVMHQRKVAKSYDAVLQKIGVPIHDIPSDYFHTYLKYPALVNDRELFIQKANQEKIELGEWFNSPIHPIQEHFENWQYHMGSNPIAERISKQIINLPTGQNIDDAYMQKICNFIIKEKAHFQVHS